MFWKKDNKLDKKIDDLNSALVHSFSNVKKDTENIFQWLNYFYNKSLEQERIIRQLQADLRSMPRSKEEVSKLIDSHYSYGPILKRIRELDDRISELSRRHEGKMNDLSSKHEERISEVSRKHEERINELSRKHEELMHEISTKKARITPNEEEIASIKSKIEKLEQKRPSLKEKIIKRLTKNSKDYVKSIILSYIKKYEKISSLQLKEMVVDEQGLCSKSSFYRIMEEIESLDDIGVIRKGNEKHYISKLTSKI